MSGTRGRHLACAPPLRAPFGFVVDALLKGPAATANEHARSQGCRPAVLCRWKARMSITGRQREVVCSIGAGAFSRHGAEHEAGCGVIRLGPQTGQAVPGLVGRV